MATDYDLAWALSTYAPTSERVRKSRAVNYYNGVQRMKLATVAFQKVFGDMFRDFNDNLCPAVVDSLAERLTVTGWRSSEATTTTEDVTGTAMPGIPARKRVTVVDPLGQAADTLWEDNEMQARSGDVHLEAIKSGNAYILVWPNRQLEPEFYPQTDAEFSLEYDPNELGVVARASKIWWLPAEEKWRLNVYLPDKICKYITREKMPNGISMAEDDWVKFNDPQTGPEVLNPYGIVPAFHFANKAVYRPGISELKDVMPIQDALNKSIMDMMVAMEYSAYRQRYIIGIEPEVDEITGEPVDSNVRNYGPDRMMGVPGEKSEVEVGEFQSTDLQQFISVSDKFRSECARVSGTPLHYFFITSGDFPSGEAIKSAEARFVAKIKKRQEDWGPVWARAMGFAQSITESLPDEYEITPQWSDPQPRSESESADIAVKKKAIGVSRSQLLKEAGYDDEEIDRMLQETDEYEAAQAALKAISSGPDNPPAAGGSSSSSSSGGTKPSPGGASATARERATAARGSTQ